jgi:PAS domain S-box-containing protein
MERPMPEERHISEDERRLRSLLQHTCDLITIHDSDGAITYESPSVARVLQYSPGALLGKSPFDLIHPEDTGPARAAFREIKEGAHPEIALELRVRRADGEWLWLESLGSNLLDDPAVRGVVMASRAITVRKDAEAQMRRRIEELSLLNAVAHIAAEAEEESALTARATAALRDSLYPEYCRILLPDEEEGVLHQVPVANVQNSFPDEERIPLPLRSRISVPIMLGQKTIGVIAVGVHTRNALTEADERVLSAVAGQLSTAIGRLRAIDALRESEERFRRLSDSAFEGICLSDRGRIIDANPRLAKMLGYNPREMVGADVTGLVAPGCREVARRRIETGTEEPCELLALKKNGEIFPVEVQARSVPYNGRNVRITALWDIAERARAEEQTRLELRRLAVLRAIDTFITSRQDLDATLDGLLHHVVTELKVDAAAVFLLKDGKPPFRLAAAKGFQSDIPRGTPLLLDESWADAATITERQSRLGDTTKEPRMPAQSHLEPGWFGDHREAPLLVKGKVKGVLEVFHREPLNPNQEWVDFLETLAGQAAIAVDNAALLENLQRSNAELEQAYDQVIEGWSRALELRDRETQGHAFRVTEMTVRLVEAIGVPKGEWVHVQRGALLHDIGKMGIPDSILLKPGPLTEEEWAVMRRHVEYACHLLYPIEFLRPAIAIPSCHHERWDGTGYPRGLAGEAIPLAARAFSVIDSWDALGHDRPYRAAWPQARIVQFLREQSGKAFDPSVVAAFLELRRQDARE